MTESKVYYGCARDRAQGRGKAYRVIPSARMRELRVSYRERRTPRHKSDAPTIRYEMIPMLKARATATVLPSGERVTVRQTA